MKVVAIMPIKLHNERLPGKNLLILDKKYLLNHELETVSKTNLVDEIYVFCSNETIKSYLPNNVIFLKRDEKLDLPSANFTQIFDSFMQKVNSDIYVYCHATAPFIELDTMKECINAVLNGENDSAFCATVIQDFLWQNGKPLNFDACNIPRSQDIPPIYRETSGIYVFRKEVFTKFRRRIGEKPYIKEVTFKESIDINTKEDFSLAEIFSIIK